MTRPRELLARNVQDGMQVKDLDTGEWLTVRAALHITSPAKVTLLQFTDGTESSVHPQGRVLVRNPEGGT